jgi:hypothetical protein
MCCSLMQMVFAAGGYLPPFVNACLQEAIDLLAISNSLRVLGLTFDGARLSRDEEEREEAREEEREEEREEATE